MISINDRISYNVVRTLDRHSTLLPTYRDQSIYVLNCFSNFSNKELRIIFDFEQLFLLFFNLDTISSLFTCGSLVPHRRTIILAINNFRQLYHTPDFYHTDCELHGHPALYAYILHPRPAVRTLLE